RTRCGRAARGPADRARLRRHRLRRDPAPGHRGVGDRGAVPMRNLRRVAVALTAAAPHPRRRRLRRQRPRRAIACLGTAISVAMAVSGCGGASGPPTLTWYTMPDNGGAATRAQQCADASNGAYDVRIETLPANATQQREQVVRRLAARDSSIDVLSMDVIYTAEFANAGFLRP